MDTNVLVDRLGRASQAASPGRLILSLWDSLIVAAAQMMRCGYLLTEDLQDGQDLGGVVVVDPFGHPPEAYGLTA